MPDIDYEEMAANYGWALSVLNSNKELKSLFRKAVQQTWSAQRFVAMVRNTKWYRTTSESARQALILQKSDPAEWKKRLGQMNAHIKTMYASMSGGRRMSAKWLTSATSQAVMFGWTDEQIKMQIAKSTGYLTLMAKDELGGEAGQLEDQIRKWSGDYGVKVSDGWIAERIKNSMYGIDSPDGVLESLKKMSKSQYRAYASDIDRGVSIRDVAESYIQSYSKILEVDPNQVDLFDNHIQRALKGYDVDKQKPTVTPLWEFEQQLKRDDRWKATKGASDELMGIGHKLLQDWGLSS